MKSGRRIVLHGTMCGRLLILIFALTLHNSALACSCIRFFTADYSLVDDKFTNEWLSNPELAIIHGRILASSYGDPVKIEIIRQFQGLPISKVAPRRGSSASCGTKFVKNEEGVYFVAGNGEVSGCGQFPADPRLIKSLVNRAGSEKKNK